MSQVTKIEYRPVIKYLTKKWTTYKIIQERVDDVYGWSLPHRSTVKEWAKRSRMGQESFDDTKLRRPMEVITENEVTFMEKLVLSFLITVIIWV